MVDLGAMPAGGALNASDFTFRVGNGNDPSTWTAAPAPSQVLVRRGAGVNGTDRVEVVWPDGAIRNEWLQVTVKADAATGLTAPDVFYFGNAIGETGNSPANAIVNATDELGARANQRNFTSPAPIDF